MGTDHTLATIHAKCTEDGDCWLWDGAMSHGVPMCSYKGQAVPVRRYVVEVLEGEVLGGRKAIPGCKQPRCVAPEHIEKLTHAEAQKLNHAELQYNSNPARRALMSGEKHWRSKLTNEQRQAVAVDTRSPVEIAKEYGITERLVYTIKSQAHSKVPPGSPWFGLVK